VVVTGAERLEQTKVLVLHSAGRSTVMEGASLMLHHVMTAARDTAARHDDTIQQLWSQAPTVELRSDRSPSTHAATAGSSLDPARAGLFQLCRLMLSESAPRTLLASPLLYSLLAEPDLWIIMLAKNPDSLELALHSLEHDAELRVPGGGSFGGVDQSAFGDGDDDELIDDVDDDRPAGADASFIASAARDRASARLNDDGLMDSAPGSEDEADSDGPSDHSRDSLYDEQKTSFDRSPSADSSFARPAHLTSRSDRTDASQQHGGVDNSAPVPQLTGYPRVHVSEPAAPQRSSTGTTSSSASIRGDLLGVPSPTADYVPPVNILQQRGRDARFGRSSASARGSLEQSDSFAVPLGLGMGGDDAMQPQAVNRRTRPSLLPLILRKGKMRQQYMVCETAHRYACCRLS